jgi:hypothetical protein
MFSGVLHTQSCSSRLALPVSLKDRPLQTRSEPPPPASSVAEECPGVPSPPVPGHRLHIKRYDGGQSVPPRPWLGIVRRSEATRFFLQWCRCNSSSSRTLGWPKGPRLCLNESFLDYDMHTYLGTCLETRSRANPSGYPRRCIVCDRLYQLTRTDPGNWRGAIKVIEERTHSQ